MLKVCEIFMCQAFPWGSLYPSTESAGKQLLTAHGILECSQTCFCRVVFLLMVATTSHNEHGCWQKKMVDMIDMFIYKWTELTCQLDCLLVRKHEYHNFAQFDSSAH